MKGPNKMSANQAKRLSKTVIAYIEYLGGRLEPSAGNEVKVVRTVVGDYQLPEPIRQFIFDVRWPAGKHPFGMKYRSQFDDYPRGVQFIWAEIEEDYICCGKHPYVQIAEDDGQFLHFIRLDCANPSNSLVYRIDHEGSDRLPKSQRLSEFLASLEQEG
jgi:hypothetical protein